MVRSPDSIKSQGGEATFRHGFATLGHIALDAVPSRRRDVVCELGHIFVHFTKTDLSKSGIDDGTLYRDLKAQNRLPGCFAWTLVVDTVQD
jgi:hypothetical protein